MLSLLTATLLTACISSPLGPQESQEGTDAPVPATDSEDLRVAPATVWLSVGEDQRLSAWLDDANIDPDSVTFSFETLDASIVQVASDGTLQANGQGTAVINVSALARGDNGTTEYRREEAVRVTVTSDDQEAAIARILGMPNMAGDWTSLAYTSAYDSIFQKWGDQYWEETGGQWGSTYYDRGLAWYAAWWRTGDVGYLERGHADVVNYRDEYVLPNNGAVPPRWANPEGLAIHYLLTGDDQSAYAISRMADILGRSWIDDMLTTQYQDGRVQGRTVLVVLIASLIDAPAVRDWSAETKQGIDAIIEWYEVSGGDGTWDMKSYCGGQANFQVAHALLEVLIRYYDLVEPDPRIPPIVKASLDYMWEWWDESGQALSYLTVSCDNGGTGAAPDLNLLSVPPFGWYYQYSGDATYRDRGDKLFEGGLWETYWSGKKQFNQSFMRSWRYLYFTG